MGRILSLVIVINCYLAFSQKEVSKWYFGNQAGLDFMTNPPTILTNGAMNVTEGCSSIADYSGNLLFYTDGGTVWNSSHQVMANGTGLFGNNTASQSSLIVKKPGSQTLYYIFTVQGAAGSSGLCYSIVDITLSSGQGSVTVKNSPLYAAAVSEKITATRHCNGTDVWIVVHEHNNSNFRSYLLTTGGVFVTAVISSIGNSYTSYFGCLKISPDGMKIGVAVSNITTSSIQIYDFNNTTGAVTNSLALSNTSGAFGCEFSPDGKKFYATDYNGKLFQWDLCAGNNTQIVASQYSINLGTGLIASLQLAPNGKIYGAVTSATHLAVINNPNNAGSACNFVANGQPISPKTCGWGLPNFVSSLIKAPVDYLQGNCNTVASFTPPPASGCASNNNTITGISWNFGEPASGSANTSTLTNPTHTYSVFGTYNVKLTISYSSCAPDTINQTVTIANMSLTVNQLTATCNGLGTATAIVMPVGPYSYTWMPTAQTASLVTNLNPGVYTISVQNSTTNCMQTFTTSIAAPSTINYSLTVIQASATCNGLGTATAVAFPSVGVYSYTWMPTWQASSVAISLNPGTHTISISNSVLNCTQTFTTLVVAPYTINYSLAITQATATCNGLGTATIYATAPYSYTWMPSLQTTSIASNLSPGVNTISVNNSALQCTQATTIFINQPVHISGVVSTSAFCSTGNANINVTNGSGNYIYSWNPGSQNTQSVTGLGPGFYFVNVTDLVNQCSFTKTLQIITLPVPNLTLSPNPIICKGEITTLTASGADIYSWGNGVTGTGYSVTVSPTVTAIYFVTGTSTISGCSTSSGITITVFNCTDIEQFTIEKETIGIYPNPNEGNMILNSPDKVNYFIIDAIGKVVRRGELEKGENPVNVENLQPGIYFIRYVSQEHLYNLRFNIQK